MAVAMQIRCALFAALTVSTLVLFFTFGVVPGLALYPWRGVYVRYVHFMIGSWHALVSLMFEWIVGVKFVYTGERPRAGEGAVVLPNHRTRMDWMLLWGLLMDGGLLWRLIIVPKWEMRALPYLGWGMQAVSYIFLRRRWDEDRAHIDRMLSLHAADARRWPGDGAGWVYLLFPEGTNMSPPNLARAHAFADKAGLPRYTHVLHPRVTGTAHFLRRLRAAGRTRAVYDVTVGFRGPAPENESALAAGRMPREVHVHTRRFALRDVPDGDGAAAAWVRERFAEKEQRLARFYASEDAVLGPPSRGAGAAVPQVRGAAAAAAAGALCWCTWCALRWASPLGGALTAAAVLAAAAGVGAGPLLLGSGFDLLDCRVWGADGAAR